MLILFSARNLLYRTFLTEMYSCIHSNAGVGCTAVRQRRANCNQPTQKTELLLTALAGHHWPCVWPKSMTVGPT